VGSIQSLVCSAGNRGGRLGGSDYPLHRRGSKTGDAVAPTFGAGEVGVGRRRNFYLGNWGISRLD